jgi:endonuclease YncB( thermonuclease family)
MYEYAATLKSIHDGDTLRLVVDLGFEVQETMIIRLYGLNAPELSTDAGKTALVYVVNWFKDNGQTVILQSHKDKQEKYGRYLGTILASNGKSLNADLLSSGNAVPYMV